MIWLRKRVSVTTNMAGDVRSPPQKVLVLSNLTLVWFRHNKNLVGVRKRSCLGLKISALLSRNAAEYIVRLPAKRYPVFDATNAKHSLVHQSLASRL